MPHVMLICPFLDPTLIRIGPLAINWYGVMYTIGALAWYFVTRRDILRRGGPISLLLLPELLFDGLVCGVIGARLGYVLVYDLHHFLDKPWEIFAFWHGGMSAHGWLVGIAIGGLLFIHEHRVSVRDLADTVYLGLPIGLAAVKIGNFINCEGFGRVTGLPWGVTVPSLGTYPRHPTQLYEAIMEGFILFAILLLLRSRSLKPGDLSCFFLVGYGCLRFMIEFSREPDLSWAQNSLSFLTSGQVLSLLVVGFGLGAYALARINPWVRAA
jgi:phosphatidylglycerol---prolipoprotein diacylglyceryl transferase